MAAMAGPQELPKRILKETENLQKVRASQQRDIHTNDEQKCTHTQASARRGPDRQRLFRSVPGDEETQSLTLDCPLLLRLCAHPCEQKPTPGITATPRADNPRHFDILIEGPKVSAATTDREERGA